MYHDCSSTAYVVCCFIHIIMLVVYEVLVYVRMVCRVFLFAGGGVVGGLSFCSHGSSVSLQVVVAFPLAAL